MNRRRTLVLGLIASLGLGISNEARATPMIFTDVGGDSSAFEAAASNAALAWTTDDFEDLAAGLQEYGQNLARNGFMISTDSDGGGMALRSTDDGGYVIEGLRTMIVHNGTDPLTLTFDSPTSVFGITFNDLDMSFGGELTYALDGGPAQTLLGAGDGDNMDYFFGIIDDQNSFSSVTFDRTGGDGYGFDTVNFIFIPEPPTLALCATAVLGMVFIRRRRKARAA